MTSVRNVVIVSDLHSNSQLGLCPPDGVRLDDGGRYTPSRLQVRLWEYWSEFVGEWLPTATRGEPFDLIVNGDAVDGKPHGAKSIISDNLSDQMRMGVACLGDIVRAARAVYFTRGTEAHVGKSGEEEERLAQELGAAPNDVGQYARPDIWYRIGGDLIHALHHIGTTGSAAYEATAVHKELVEEFVAAARWGEQPPSVVVRSHRHSCIETRIPADITSEAWGESNGTHEMAIAFTTACWQLKPMFAWKIPGARLQPPQIGGSLVRVSEEGVIYARHFVKTVGRSKEVGAARNPDGRVVARGHAGHRGRTGQGKDDARDRRGNGHERGGRKPSRKGASHAASRAR